MADVKVKVQVEAARAQAQIAKFRSQADKAQLSTKKMAAQLKNVELRNKKLSSTFKNVTNSVKSSSRAFDVFRGTLAANLAGKAVQGFVSLTKSIIGFGVESLKTSAEIETLKTQITVLTGSVGEADKLLTDLLEFASGTPFEIKELTETTQKLLAFGLTADEVRETLPDLGDVAAASGAPISDLARVFGQVSAAGKLTGERLLQLEERAIPIGRAIAQTMGVQETAVRDLVSQGKVGFAEFERAFKSLNDVGGPAFEGMIKRSKTLQGRISNLQDSFTLLKNQIGKSLKPTMSALVKTLSDVIDALRKSSVVKSFSDNIGKILQNAIVGTVRALNSFIQFATPFIKTIRVIGGGVAGLARIMFEFPRTLINMGSGLLKFAGLSDTVIGKMVSGAASAVNSLTNLQKKFAQNTAKSLKDIDKFSKTSDTVLKNLEKRLLDNFAKQKLIDEQSSKSTETKTNKQKTLEKELTASISEEQKAREEQLKKHQDQLASIREENRQLELAERLTDGETTQVWFDSNLEEYQIYLTDRQQREVAARILSAKTEVERQIEIAKAQQAGLKARGKAEQNFQRQQVQLDMRTARARASVMSGFFNLAGVLAKKGSKEQFAIQQAGALASGIVAAQLATLQARTAPPGPPLNEPIVAATRVAGYLNVAAIAAQTIQGFQDGGVIGGQSFSGDRVLARVNSGEMILNRQQQSNLFKIANSGGGQNVGQEITVHTTVELDGEAIGQSVSKQVANGLELGEVQ